MAQQIEQTENQATESARLGQAIVGLMETLTQTMETEMTLLTQQDFAAIEKIRETKARLFRDYHSNVHLLMQNPTLMAAAPDQLRAKLRTSNARLDEVSRRNAAALKAAIGATQSLIDTIIDGVRHETRKNDCYKDPRKMVNVLGAYSPTCAPVAVNRTA